MNIAFRRNLIVGEIYRMESRRQKLQPTGREAAKDEAEKSARQTEESERLRDLEALDQEICKAKTTLRFIDERNWDGNCIGNECPNEKVISEARIKAMPYALRCTQCDEEIQQRRAGYQAPERRRGRHLSAR